ncbi:10306_t:CDS:2, partial [Dentiscutata heterogama]
GLGDHNTPPIIVDIKTFDDGTILVHIIRNESTQIEECSKIGGISLEQKLRIRLIFLNGTVKEIDPNLNLDPINYCLLNRNINPITIYPLQKPFILVTYVKTNDSSNLAFYEECGEIIDWDGISKSNMCFNSSSSHWKFWINSTIQLKANKKLGFIRFVQVDGHGNLTNLTNLILLDPSIGIPLDPSIGITGSPTQYSLMSIVSTIDSGYLVIFRYVQESNKNSLVPHGGLFTMFIFYNQPDFSNAAIIYTIPQPNITIKSVDCDVAHIGNIAQFVEITNQTQQGLRAKIMPFDKAIMGSVRLTTDALTKFLNLSKHNQSAYIDSLLNELADKVPINRNNEIKSDVSELFSDLNTMIIYKNITTFSLGITNDLDLDYGFQPRCKECIE